MVTPLKTALLAVAAIGTMAFAGMFAGANTYASTANPSLAFSPRCVSPTAGVALFEINSDETDTVTLHYRNAAGEGTQDLQRGNNLVFVPYYDGMDLNTAFDYGANSQHKTEVQVHDTCTFDQLATYCVDATDASNLRVVWTSPSQITIATKNGLPACESVELYYSTYRMPDNYDGQGFYLSDGTVNPTAIPQTGQDVYTFEIEGGTFGTWLMNVPAPDFCYNTQADLYYGPEITNIGGDGYGYNGLGNPTSQPGHGTQNIASQIFGRDAAQCQGGQGGGNGGTTTPVTTSGGQGAGTVMTTSTPTVLPNTGVDLSGNILSSVFSLIFGAMSTFALGVRALRG